MIAIIGGSSLTIAASSAIDGTKGCFFPREIKPKCQIKTNSTRRTSIIECFSSGIEEGISSSVLSTRGWVVQERALACRTVHFTDQQIYWECNHHVACETFPYGTTDEWKYQFPFVRGPITLDMWPSIILAYSKSSLTYEKDKLVAMSGLAQHVQASSGDEYIAGLWRNQMALDLCWIPVQPAKTRKSHDYIAPSWSWASIDSTNSGIAIRPALASPGSFVSSESIKMPNYTNFDNEVDVSYMTIVQINIDYCTDDCFGAISYAVMRLSCPWILCATINQICLPSGETKDSESNMYTTIGGVRLNSVDIIFDYASLYEEKVIESRLLLLNSQNGWLEQGIVLRPGCAGKFERIGAFFSHERDVVNYLSRMNIGLIEDSECIKVFHKDGEKEFLIDLI